MLQIDQITKRKQVLAEKILNSFGKGIMKVPVNVLQKGIEEKILSVYTVSDIKKFRNDFISKAEGDIKGQSKFEKVMKEFGDGKLKDGATGKTVTDKGKALAIAYASAREINPNFEKDYAANIKKAEDEVGKLSKVIAVYRDGKEEVVFIGKSK